jgi:hypothetical protein
VSPGRAAEAIEDLVDLDLHRHIHLDLVTRAWKLRENLTGALCTDLLRRCVVVARVLITFLMLSGARPIAAAAQQPPEEGPLLLVGVYEYFHVAPQTAEHAVAVAGRIFARAGVRTAWEVCPCADDSSAIGREPAAASRILELTVELVPEATARHLGLTAEAWGIALVPRGADSGSVAIVMGDKLKESTVSCPPGILLAHVMAHEVGHLLLGAGHTLTGIMKGPWSVEDLEAACQETLFFSADQAARLRERVLERSRTVTGPIRGSRSSESDGSAS